MKPIRIRSDFFLLLLLAVGSVSHAPATAFAATINGTVRAQSATAGTPGEEDGGSYGSRRYKFIERVNYEELTDFIIYIDQPVPAESLPDPRPLAIVTQRDGMFQPHVLPIVVGTTVEWPNEDTIFHNVFSISESSPFDLGLYKNGEKARQVTFGKIGRVDVFCSIHKKMNCIVLVLPNPWFARADARGKFSIPNVPPGTYPLKAWHERLPAKTVSLVVPAHGDVTAEFVLGFAPPPKS